MKRITGFLKERKNKKRELERIAKGGDYRLLTDMLREEIKKGSYDFVSWRVLKVDLPKNYLEELMETANNHKPPLKKRILHFYLKTQLEMKLTR